jgi:polyhydroxybutyrate depolymerase
MVGIDGGRLLELAEENRFALLYPRGWENSWNDQREDPLSPAHSANLNDVSFVENLIQEIQIRYPGRIGSISIGGISNGGMFTFRMICESKLRFSGSFAVTANLPSVVKSKNLCPKPKYTNLTILNGTEDSLVPYSGGPVKVFGKERGEVISTRETEEFFQRAWSCGERKTSRKIKSIPDDPTSILLHSYSCPFGKIQSLEIREGGHTWPGGLSFSFLGKQFLGNTSYEISASEIIADSVTHKVWNPERFGRFEYE